MQTSIALPARTRRIRRRRLAAVLLLFVACVSVGSTVRASSIPFGSLESLDGTLGHEWDQAYSRAMTIRYQRTSCACSATYAEAELHLFHNAENLYVGLSLHPTSHPYDWTQFQVLVILDTDDGLLGDAGDNLLIVSSQDAGLVTTGLDHHYPAYSGSPLRGGTLDLQQDAAACGDWNPLTCTYSLEMRVPMQSEDPCDTAIVPGRPLNLMVGFRVLDRTGATMFSGKSTAISALVAP